MMNELIKKTDNGIVVDEKVNDIFLELERINQIASGYRYELYKAMLANGIKRIDTDDFVIVRKDEAEREQINVNEVKILVKGLGLDMEDFVKKVKIRGSASITRKKD